MCCPRCGTGNFKQGRSLSMHLTQFCSWPMLLCHAQPSILQSKRSNDQMRNISSKTTFQQQIRTFNSLTTDVSLLTRNPLQSLPSLQHLSLTQSELENSNVNYSGFTLTCLHHNQLMMNLSLMIHQQPLSLRIAPSREIQYNYHRILLFKYIICPK
jgi:hypothetical protein